MEIEKAKEEALKLLHEGELIHLATEDGSQPEVRMMAKLGSDNFDVWLATSKASRKVKQTEENPKVSVYIANPKDFSSLQIFGEFETHDHPETKQQLWREKWKAWFPKGVEDEDYLPIRVKAQKVRYMKWMDNVEWEAS